MNNLFIKIRSSYISIIFSIIVNLFLICALIPYAPGSGCTEQKGTLDFTVKCDYNTPEIIYFLANIPHDFTSSFHWIIQFLLLPLIGLALYIISAYTFFEVIYIWKMNDKINVNYKVLALLVIDILLLVFVILAILGWFIPEIPNIIRRF